MDRLEEERVLRFSTFTNEDAFEFGIHVVNMVKEENLKNVRIRVTYEDDIIFQYLMNDKYGKMWLDRKEKTVMESKHSSLYVYENQDQFKHMLDNDEYAVCGGGFPLIVNDEIKGVFIVSGLSHQDDHRLIIQALQKMITK